MSAYPGGTLTVTGPDAFAQWYHDVPGVNVTLPYEIPLEESATRPGLYQFTSINFFPLDGDPRGFGDEGQGHDFDFTLATKFTFRYSGGELFGFTGDDALWYRGLLAPLQLGFHLQVRVLRHRPE